MTHDSAREVIARQCRSDRDAFSESWRDVQKVFEEDLEDADRYISALQSAGYAVVPVADRLTASQQLRNLAKGLAHVDLKTTAEERSHNLVWADEHTYAHRSAADIAELLEALGAINGLSAMLSAARGEPRTADTREGEGT